MYKKIISTIVIMAMMIGMCAASMGNVTAADEDGDICTNPWEELFTTAGELDDLEMPNNKETTVGNSDNKEETTGKKNDNKNETTVVVKKTKIKKATKKLASTKARIKIKKVKGVTGYKLQFSTKKKFKNILYKRNVNKIKVTVTSKKLKNKKKLYVRVKAYKVVDDKKVWAKKWSKAKKVSVK